MKEFVESLKRLYVAKKIDIEKLNKLYSDKKVTKAEFEYITHKEA